MAVLGGILAVLLALAGLFGCGALTLMQGGDAMPIPQFEPAQPIDPMQPEPTFRSEVIVTGVMVTVEKIGGPRITLDVTGYNPDGCEYPVISEILQSDSTFTVQLYRDVPLAATCLAIQVDYEGMIVLEPVEEGITYTIYVNGYLVEVTV